MRVSLFNLLLLCLVLVLLTGVASAGPRCGQKGPVRQFVHDSRPGIIFPKDGAAPAVSYAPVPHVTGGASCAPCGSPTTHFTPAQPCPGGKCPLK